MKKFRNLIFTIFLLSASTSYAQTTVKENKIPRLTINNEQFKAIIDSFMEATTKCPYYYDSMILWVNISDMKKYIHIRLEGIPRINYNRTLSMSYQGYSYFKNHLIVFWADTSFKAFCSVGDTMVFKYIDPSPFINYDEAPLHWSYQYYRRKKQFKLGGKSVIRPDEW